MASLLVRTLQVAPGALACVRTSRCSKPARTATNSRRHAIMAPLLFSLPFPGTEVPPAKFGDCADCLGPFNDTLASCSGFPGACVSSYDDSPQHFVNPWVYEGKNQSAVLSQLEQYISMQEDLEGPVDREGNYLHAQIRTATGIDDLEFLVPTNDTTVELRASSRTAPLFRVLDAPGVFRQWGRFEEYRIDLGYEILPVLRNRQSILGGIVETPFDNFGPPPPAGENIENLLRD